MAAAGEEESNEKTKDDAAAATKKPAAAAPGQQPSAAEETASPYPKMDLCQKIHRLTTAAAAGAGTAATEELQTAVFEQIAAELQNPSLYRQLQKTLLHSHDENNATMQLSSSATSKKLVLLEEEALAEQDEKNAAELESLEEKVERAKESAGDMEVMEARVLVARFAAKSLSEQDAVSALQKVLELPKISSGKKIDALMESARCSSFYGNTAAADEYIDRAQKLAVAGGGGDWDRRNRLKVYRALQKLLHRDTAAAAELLLDCIATFSCNEICSYEEFVAYCCLTNLLHLPRPRLKEKIIDGPEVLSVADDIPVVIKLVRSFYDCNYKEYLQAMVQVEDVLLKDRYLQPHAAYWMRELHIQAHRQFLDSYQSVTLRAMAEAFGVSTDFIDRYASRFIAAGRLSAKIDKYGGVIVTARPDEKNAQYREMIQKGDLLLNRIQKLARVVDL